MDKFCHYIEAIDRNGNVKSNGSVFLVEHAGQSLLLTAAHTLRNYNDFIFPDFHNWHAEYIKLHDNYVRIYSDFRNPLFAVYPKNHRELLDAIVLPHHGPAGPIDYNFKIGDPVKLCGWRKAPDKTKFILDSRILHVNGWDICLDMSLHSSLQRSGISGGGVYTERGFVGIYFADDIGKPTAHAVNISWLMWPGL